MSREHWFKKVPNRVIAVTRQGGWKRAYLSSMTATPISTVSEARSARIRRPGTSTSPEAFKRKRFRIGLDQWMERPSVMLGRSALSRQNSATSPEPRQHLQPPPAAPPIFLVRATKSIRHSSADLQQRTHSHITTPPENTPAYSAAPSCRWSSAWPSAGQHTP